MAFDISAPVIDTTGSLATISAPVINNLGTIAFSGGLDSGESVVYTSRNNVLTTIVSNTFISGAFRGVSLNNNDAIIYELSESQPPFLTSNTTLFFNQNGTTSTITSVFNDRQRSAGIGSAQVNDSNNTVVQTYLNGPGISISDITLFRADGTSEEIVTAGSFSSFALSSVRNPVINNQNVIAYIGETNNTQVTSIYATDGRTISFATGEAEALGINDLGTLLFTWKNESFGGEPDEALYQNARNQTTLLASTAGLFNDFNNLSLNDNGDFAFDAILDGGVKGIFAGADPVKDRVIAVGDALANSTVVDLEFSSQGLNNSDVITFWAELANGNAGIFTATRQDQPPVPNVINGTNQSERLVGTAGIDLIKGNGGRDKLIGLAGNDQLLGGSGNDILIGGDSRSDSLNGDEVDRLIGGKGVDTFVLGDRTQVFYNDGNAATQGLKSYAAIADFSAQDLIQLQGNANQYLLKDKFALWGKVGTGIFLKNKVNELIGFVEGVSELTLTQADFKFVSAL